MTEAEILKNIEKSLEGEANPEPMSFDAPTAKETSRLPPLTPEPSRRKKGPREKLYEFKGERLPLSVWASRLATTPDVLRNRIKHGWTIERAFTEPVHAKAALVKVASRQISHPDYVPTSTSVAKMPAKIAEIDAEVDRGTKRMILADNASTADLALVDTVPAAIQLIRDRCARLDEIDYEISLLRQERKQIVEKLENK
jgi:hypothetical protein